MPWSDIAQVTHPDLVDPDQRQAEPALIPALPGVHSVYQPIVDLSSGDVIAYEALARGPRGSTLESPAALFAYAREHGAEAELEFRCQAAAMGGAIERRLPTSVPLFVNAEPRWLGRPWPHHLAHILDQARSRLQVVIEITERSLVDDPAALLAAVRRIREAGWGVALDDVGADPASMALMPFIEPDVIKLDLRLIQEHTNAEIAAIVNAVIAQAERSGAIVLAEGIETEEHRARAMAMGATLGQGWLLGRPVALPEGLAHVAGHDLSFTRGQYNSLTTPFEMIQAVRPVRATTKALLLPMSHHLEGHAFRTSEAPILLSTFEEARHFTAATAIRYEQLAERCSFVGVMGAGMAHTSVPGVRGVDLTPEDRLAGEWVVCVVGPHFSGALIAKDRGDTGVDRDRRFDFVITYDRDLVLDAARNLLSRVANI
jgi:EAL domain-containing protein (putative c-di-GMP-specific phosphodiesterase class I)/DICT domain-containing protein